MRLGQITPETFGLNVNEITEGPLYDRVQHGASITAGTEYVYFRDIANKDKADTNMQVSKKLPTGWKMVVWKVGVVFAAACTIDDAKLIADNAVLNFEVDNRSILEGPVIFFPIGFGLYGAVTTTATATTIQVVSNGSPSPNAAAPLSKPIVLTGENTFQATIKYYDAVTLSAATNVYVVLWGWIQKPIR